MATLDSFGALVSSVIAVVLMLVLSILSFYITVFIVDIGAGIAGLSPPDGYTTLAAAVLAGAAIVAGASPLSGVGPVEEG
ncbi:MAG: hypothetical protein ABEJ89_04410 [Haloarculaceae archaeon]